MAHYAFLDDKNIVTEVIVGKNENEDGIDWEQHYGNYRGQRCKRTSYNTYGGKHILGGTPFRKNFAEIGGTYDEINDAFYAARPYDSWILDQTTFLWNPPIPYPKDGNFYIWNEESKTWVKIPNN